MFCACVQQALAFIQVVRVSQRMISSPSSGPPQPSLSGALMVHTSQRCCGVVGAVAACRAAQSSAQGMQGAMPGSEQQPGLLAADNPPTWSKVSTGMGRSSPRRGKAEADSSSGTHLAAGEPGTRGGGARGGGGGWLSKHRPSASGLRRRAGDASAQAAAGRARAPVGAGALLAQRLHLAQVQRLARQPRRVPAVAVAPHQQAHAVAAPVLELRLDLRAERVLHHRARHRQAGPGVFSCPAAAAGAAAAGAWTAAAAAAAAAAVAVAGMLLAGALRRRRVVHAAGAAERGGRGGARAALAALLLKALKLLPGPPRVAAAGGGACGQQRGARGSGRPRMRARLCTITLNTTPAPRSPNQPLPTKQPPALRTFPPLHALWPVAIVQRARGRVTQRVVRGGHLGKTLGGVARVTHVCKACGGGDGLKTGASCRSVGASASPLTACHGASVQEAARRQASSCGRQPTRVKAQRGLPVGGLDLLLAG